MIYKGQFSNGTKHGNGQLQILHPKTGEITLYEGEFSSNMFSGFGVYTYPQSSQKLFYKGQWS